jgi:hypothetical protein
MLFESGTTRRYRLDLAVILDSQMQLKAIKEHFHTSWMQPARIRGWLITDSPICVGGRADSKSATILTYGLDACNAARCSASTGEDARVERNGPEPEAGC